MITHMGERNHLCNTIHRCMALERSPFRDLLVLQQICLSMLRYLDNGCLYSEAGPREVSIQRLISLLFTGLPIQEKSFMNMLQDAPICLSMLRYLDNGCLQSEAGPREVSIITYAIIHVISTHRSSL